MRRFVRWLTPEKEQELLGNTLESPPPLRRRTKLPLNMFEPIAQAIAKSVFYSFEDVLWLIRKTCSVDQTLWVIHCGIKSGISLDEAYRISVPPPKAAMVTVDDFNITKP